MDSRLMLFHHAETRETSITLRTLVIFDFIVHHFYMLHEPVFGKALSRTMRTSVVPETKMKVFYVTVELP